MITIKGPTVTSFDALFPDDDVTEKSFARYSEERKRLD